MWIKIRNKKEEWNDPFKNEELRHIHDSEKYYRELRMNYKKLEIKNYEFRMKNYDRFLMEYC